MISKELLSEVLKEDLSSNKIEFEQADGVDSSRIVIDNWLTINIYELANKCKKWALNQKIDNCPKENPFKYKVLSNLDIVVYKHSIEDGYVSKISPLLYSDDTNLDVFGINLNTYDSTIISNTFNSLVFYADTEVEAIIKACGWIMENKCGS